MRNRKDIYIIYTFDKFNNDFIYLKEYFDVKDLQQNNDIKLGNTKSIYYYIQKEIKEQNKLVNDKYLIIKETL